MTTSISGSAKPAPLLPTVALFDRFGKPIKPGDPSKRLAEQHRAKVRKARHEVELQAIEYARVLQDQLLARALDPKTDPKLASDIAFKLLDRAVGRVRDAESDTDPKQKGPSGDLHDFLEALSAVGSALEQQGKAAPRIERDVTDPDQGQYLDLDQFKESDDDH